MRRTLWTLGAIGLMALAFLSACSTKIPPPRPGEGGPPPPPLPPLAELRARSADEVSKTLRGAGMIVDGWIVPEDESITYANGKQNAVDVIAGFNKDEHTSLGGDPAFRDTMAWAMRLFVERQVALGKKGYWYTFTH